VGTIDDPDWFAIAHCPGCYADEHLQCAVFLGTLHDMESFYANESTVGRVRSGDVPFAIGILRPSDNSRPSGVAFEIGSTVDDLAVWRLKVAGERVPGRFIIVDGRFLPVDDVSG
jgi:hypothetical protein